MSKTYIYSKTQGYFTNNNKNVLYHSPGTQKNYESTKIFNELCLSV